jgi:hypothetical protein
MPIIKSSTASGFTCGTLAISALTICVDMSSGRRVVNEPLLARPIGLRAVATITASGMVTSFVSGSVAGLPNGS